MNVCHRLIGKLMMCKLINMLNWKRWANKIFLSISLRLINFLRLHNSSTSQHSHNWLQRNANTLNFHPTFQLVDGSYSQSQHIALPWSLSTLFLPSKQLSELFMVSKSFAFNVLFFSLLDLSKQEKLHNFCFRLIFFYSYVQANEINFIRKVLYR